MPYNILLIEDESDTAKLITHHLKPMSGLIKHVNRGIHALNVIDKQRWDLVLLDLKMPDMDGIEICTQLRELNPNIPIIVVTAKASSMEILECFDAGADDYITKPFKILELVARVRAILRRIASEKEQSLVYNDLEIDTRSHTVYVSGYPHQLTRKELQLLVCFAKSPGQVFNRDELLNVVWGSHYNGYSHTVNSHINRLRQKIEPDPKRPRFIQTIWGVGYKFIH